MSDRVREALRIEPIGTTDPHILAEFWRRCGLVVPHNPPLAGTQDSDILLSLLGDELVASVMVGHDGHRGWLYYLAVAPERRREGHGATMVRAAEAWLRARGVRKMQLMVRASNDGVIGFDDRFGYERSTVTVMQRWLVADPLAAPEPQEGDASGV